MTGTELVAVAAARRKVSASEKRRIVAEAMRAGANVAAVARAHGLHPNRVYAWREAARGAGGSRLAAAPRFVPVTVSDGAVGASARVEVISPRGYRVILHGALGDLALVQVLALVERP